jgi:hypothetical protein
LEPTGHGEKGRPKKTWKRSVVEEAQREGRTWRELKCWQRTEVDGEASWKPFAPTKETVVIDDDIVYEHLIRCAKVKHKTLSESSLSTN